MVYLGFWSSLSDSKGCLLTTKPQLPSTCIQLMNFVVLVLLKALSCIYVLQIDSDRTKTKPLTWNGFPRSSLGLEGRHSIWYTAVRCRRMSLRNSVRLNPTASILCRMHFIKPIFPITPHMDPNPCTTAPKRDWEEVSHRRQVESYILYSKSKMCKSSCWFCIFSFSFFFFWL